MKRWVQRSAHERTNEDGFTLVEILVTIVIVGGVTAGVLMTLLASLKSSDTSQKQTRESNDAQVISNYIVRDVQDKKIVKAYIVPHW